MSFGFTYFWPPVLLVWNELSWKLLRIGYFLFVFALRVVSRWSTCELFWLIISLLLMKESCMPVDWTLPRLFEPDILRVALAWVLGLIFLFWMRGRLLSCSLILFEWLMSYVIQTQVHMQILHWPDHRVCFRRSWSCLGVAWHCGDGWQGWSYI